MLLFYVKRILLSNICILLWNSDYFCSVIFHICGSSKMLDYMVPFLLTFLLTNLLVYFDTEAGTAIIHWI